MSTENPTFAELIEMPSRVSAVPANNIAALLGQLEYLRALLLARLISEGVAGSSTSSIQAPSPSQDRLLTPAEAAALMGVKVRWLYQHHRSLPFTRKLSPRTLRFHEPGLYRWVAHRHG
jgi:hypothetical protein